MYTNGAVKNINNLGTGTTMNQQSSRVFTAILLLASTGLFAQENTGTVGRSPSLTPELKKPAAAPIAQPAKATDASPVPSGGKKITIKKFEFTGNSVFSADELAAVVADYTARPVDLAEIYDAADVVATFYAEKGYTLASVGVPAQRIGDGVVRFEVVEGRLGAVTSEGNKSYSDEQIDKNLARFTKGTVYRGDELEVALKNLNTLPGLSVQAVLTPGDDYGTSDLLIRAQEKPSAAVLTADNYGRKALGEYRGSLVLQLNNPAGLADQFQALLLGAGNQNLLYGFLQYSLPLYVGGPRLAVSYSQAAIKQNVTGGILLDGTNRNVRAGLTWSLLRTKADELNVSVGGSYTDSSSDLAGLSISRTQVPLAEFTANYNHLYEGGAVSQVTAGLTTNFESGDISDCTGSGECDQQLARLELDFQHLQPIGGGFDAYARLNGTTSFGDAMPSTSKTIIGGPASVRGFATAAATGDSGYFVSTGLRYGLIAGPALLQLRAFADHGYVYTEIPNTPGFGSDIELTSVGVGADVGLGGVFNAKLDVSNPIGNSGATFTEGRDDVRAFASVSVSF